MQLVESLTRSECVAMPLDDTTVEVLHVNADNEREARMELVFFLRAWAGRHPHVHAELVA